jgi:hypothetical protein
MDDQTNTVSNPVPCLPQQGTLVPIHPIDADLLPTNPADTEEYPTEYYPAASKYANLTRRDAESMLHPWEEPEHARPQVSEAVTF